MTTPMRGSDGGAPSEMTPERWRVVDTILQAALACEADRRADFVKDACGADESLKREVESLLSAHDDMASGFLEQPPVEALRMPDDGAPNDRRATALSAALAGRYSIEREIAHGGMATVFLARDLRHGRQVAMKVMRDEVAAAVGAERFLEEIRVTASLQHPHILPLFDSGSVGSVLWYAMPFVEGETLRSRLTRTGRLPVDEAVRIAREMADALEHAHAHGIVHRDVKPENVLLQGGHALVADFGIALALEHAGGERLTRTGLTLGTPQYMAPEQAAGERALDARVDVYALGAVLHEMVAGEPPFTAESRQALVLQILHEAPTSLAAQRPDIPLWLDSVVSQALAKRPDARFPSAASFAEALAAPHWLQESATNDPPRGRDNARHANTTRVASLAAVAGILAGFVGGWGFAHSPVAGRWASHQADSQAPANAAVVAYDADAAPASADALSLVIVDRAGQPQRTIAANRPWTPRFSPDGRRVAYGAFGAGRRTSDVWVTDLDAGTTRRLTDDSGDSNDPQWSPDGTVVGYSVAAPGGKDVASRPLGGGPARVIASRPGTQFPSDWLRDGSALIVTDDAGAGGHDILVQPTDGSAAQPYAATGADETAGRVSPNGRWMAYTSDESGRPEVYLDAFPRPGHRLLVSQGGGVHPVWRGDGKELYYWRNGALVAVQVAATKGIVPSLGEQSVLFRAPYEAGINTMYDASPDGQRFVIVEHR